MTSLAGGTVALRHRSASPSSSPPTCWQVLSPVGHISLGGHTELLSPVTGLLAYAIGHMDGMHGYHGWRWIFILGTHGSQWSICTERLH